MLFVVLYSIAACGTFLKEANDFVVNGGNMEGLYDMEDCLMDLSFALTWPITWVRYCLGYIYDRTGWWPRI
jgi:hypothetical protein